MFSSDLSFIFKWWFTIFIIGSIFLPLTTKIFSNFFDKGYIFSKILGFAIVSYAIFILGILHVLPFTQTNSIIIFILFLIINFLIGRNNFISILKQKWKIFAFEEIIFLAGLIFWSFIRGHQPDIHGLEKFMDFGFINSILRSDYFPPTDMWFTPLPINYYYFGHLITAVLTKISNINSSITYNLMVATIFSLTFTGVFSIGLNLLSKLNIKRYYAIFGGLLTAFIATFGGNIHAIYTFFKPYPNENPVPFWDLAFSLQTFPNGYWYPNATRFIHNTIHEFPIYSFVVSDLHGHVLDIPFVLLTIALLLSILISKYLNIFKIILIGFLLAVMYMTNVWDGAIYLLLTIILTMYLNLKSSTLLSTKYLLHTIYYILLTVGVFFTFSLPFNFFFKPFASGIGILCAPKFLTDIGRIGPFFFEINHCQHSPLWQLLILYGFFFFQFLVFLYPKIKNWLASPRSGKLDIGKFSQTDIFVFILIILSTLLIIIPEFIYLKDIYPAHYRANTMFKLVYQSFIMLSIASGYIIVKRISNLIMMILGSIGLLLIMLYPYFAINSYYGDLKNYYGIDGTKYLKNLYPDDYKAIEWINKNIKKQPVALEAQGDSYTDYERISANTGLPTVLGWTVHEWLWRGTYDIPASRINDVKMLYESSDLEITKKIIKQYNISLVIVGNLEYQKYPNLDENKFLHLGKVVFKNNSTKIYQIN